VAECEERHLYQSVRDFMKFGNVREHFQFVPLVTFNTMRTRSRMTFPSFLVPLHKKLFFRCSRSLYT